MNELFEHEPEPPNKQLRNVVLAGSLAAAVALGACNNDDRKPADSINAECDQKSIPSLTDRHQSFLDLEQQANQYITVRGEGMMTNTGEAWTDFVHIDITRDHLTVGASQYDVAAFKQPSGVNVTPSDFHGSLKIVSSDGQSNIGISYICP